MKIRVDYYRSKGARIGENARLFSAINGPEAYLVTIGNNVTVSTNVNFCTHDNSAIKIYDDATDFVGPIVIGDNCFVGTGSILMGGVTIGSDCIIGAGSVVTHSFIDPCQIIGGNPGRVIGTVDEYRKRNADYRFDFRGKSYVQKRDEILQNRGKWRIR